jgi:hypothetical protein
MKLLQPVLLSAMFVSALAGPAAATERPPRIGEHKIVPKIVPKSAPKQPDTAKPAPAAPAKKPAKRRAVRQILDDEVRSAAPSAVYAPQLTHPGAVVQPMSGPASPVILNCVGASCADASGARFNGGIGTTLISPQGKLCVDNGLTVQCH